MKRKRQLALWERIGENEKVIDKLQARVEGLVLNQLVLLMIFFSQATI